MATYKDTGIIEKIYEGAHIEWRICDLLSIDAAKDPWTSYNSSTFIFYDVSWYLELFPRSPSNKKFTRLYLNTNVEREYCTEYSLGLKNSDGKVQQLVSGILEGNKRRTGAQDLIKFSELLHRKSELAPQNVLAIICRLKHGNAHHSIHPITSDKTMSMKLIRLDKLSEYFKDLFGDKETCDVTLKVKDKEYKGHRSVLVARSNVFAATFKHDTLERQTGVITISDCDPDSFQEFLEYLYSGKLEELSAHSALSLYYTSNKYDVEELKAFCVEYLMQSLTVETVCEIGVFASGYDEVQLFSVVQDFFNKNFLQIFLTSEWKQLLKNDYQLVNKLLEGMAKMKLEE